MSERTAAIGTREDRWALAGLLVFTVMALFGYGVFARHPERIPTVPALQTFYTVSFQFFARTHIVVAAIALAVPLTRVARFRWLPSLVAVYVLSFLCEHIGTGFGLPFGDYAYTGLLGPRLGDRVPIVIPLSWYLMALPSYVLASRALPGRSRRLARILSGAALLTIYDLALDPAMAFLTAYWRWGQPGPYYGMPWINLFGWMVTGVLLMLALERMTAWADALSARWLAAYYGTVLLMPLGMLALALEWPAILTTGGALAAAAFVLLRNADRAPMSLSQDPAAVSSVATE